MKNLIREWMKLPRDKQQTEEHAADFAANAVKRPACDQIVKPWQAQAARLTIRGVLMSL